jgi:uncharacterized membrane protein YcgQ (UPF0703/DUF1980 family)
MEGWIKLYRKFSEWEWFNISEMVHLFIYLLLNANHEEGTWRGIIIKRGQILTGLNTLNEKTGISIRSLRTCLDRLQKTKEIDRQTTNKYSLITICNYESYQGNGITTDKQTDKQPTSNRQATDKQPTTNKNNKEEKELGYGEFYNSEIDSSNGDENYLRVVQMLYGENNLGIKLDVVLKIQYQLTYEQFKKLWYLKTKYKFSFTEIFERIQDWGNPKKRKTVYGVFLTFAKRDNPDIKLQ